MPQLKKISKNNTTVVMEDGIQKVILHNTIIVKHNAKTKHVQFDTGGYFTATTRNRMNQAMAQFGIPLWVYSEKGQWTVGGNNHKVPFINDVCIVSY